MPFHLWACHVDGVLLAVNSEEAINHYNKILAIEPDNMGALHNKGNSLYNLGRYVEAIKYYDKVIKPDLAIAQENRDLAYKQLGNPANSTGYEKAEKSR